MPKPPSEFNKFVNRVVVRVNVYHYRRSGGRFLGRFGKLDLLLLTTQGRRTGRSYTNPVGYLYDAGSFAVCAAYGGEAVHPSWFKNLCATSSVTVEIGRQRIPATAKVLPPGPDRDRIWQRFVDVRPIYARFQNRTERLLPIVLLTPTD
jgi:deazaflavin-dependent oxidoreductase (nitroreductase family)